MTDVQMEIDAHRSVSDHLLFRGLEQGNDAELLAVLIDGSMNFRSDVMLRTQRALAMLRGVSGLMRAGAGELRAVLGVRAAARVMAALELVRRGQCRVLQREVAITSSRVVGEVYGPRLRDLAHEEVIVLALDARCRPMAERVIAQGVATSCAVDIRTVFAWGVREGAAQIVVVHNHPSGDPTPSRDDVQWTHRLARGGDLLGLPLLDHVIVARDGVRSFRDLGLLPLRGATVVGETQTEVK